MSNYYTYEASVIKVLAPDSPGVYVIRNALETPVYVGLAHTSIKDRLLQHREGWSSQSACINSWSPTRFRFEVIYNQNLRWDKERELQLALSPRCNRT